MAAAVNKRVWSEILNLLCWGADAAHGDIGGSTAIGVVQGYLDRVRSTFDGHAGPTGVDSSGGFTRWNVATTDIIEGLKLYAGPAVAANTSLVWYGRESGKTTMSKATIAQALAASLSLSVARGSHATLTVGGEAWVSDDTHSFKNACKIEDAVAALDSITVPARLYHPVSATYDSVALTHLQSVTLNVTANLLAQYGDGDAHVTALDREQATASVTIELAEAAESGVTTGDVRAALLTNPGHDLVVTLRDSGAVSTHTLTIKNIHWQEGSRDGQSTHTGISMTGEIAFHDGTNVYTVLGGYHPILAVAPVA